MTVTIKPPVIPSPNTERDIQRGMENLRNFFTSLQNNGFDFGTQLAALGENLKKAQDLADLHNVITARKNLGLGSMSLQDSSLVFITGGTIGGLTVGVIAGHIPATVAHGTTGNILGDIDAQVVSNKKYGGASDYSEFETDGTLHFVNNATVWKDIMFPQSVPKATGAGNPTLTTWNGGLQGYSYAVNDTHAFNPEEIEHDALVGSTATWHIHWISRSNDGTDRAVKWQLEYAIEPTSGAYPATTTISAEFTVPAGSAVNTEFRSDIGTFTIPNIARLVWVTIKRITASGTAPSVDPIVGAVHFHYEIDTVGSRQITTK